MSDSKTPEQIMREQVSARVAEERGASNAASAVSELPEVKPDFVARCLDANEMGDGILFSYLFGSRHAYVGQADEWIFFMGHHWHVDLVDKAHRASMDVEHVALCYDRTSAHYRKLADEARASGDKERAGGLTAKAEKLKARAHKLRSQSGRMRCLDFAKTNLEAPLAIRGDEIDCAPWALPVANGVIDLKTGDIRDGRPDDYMMKSSPVKWEGIDAPCPTWERFVLEVMDDAPDMASFLQRLFGYGITGLSTEHVFVVFFGRGRNGKGIMTEVIQEVLGGRDATAALAGPIQSEMLMDQGKRNAAGPSPDIMALRGLRLAFASETDEGQKFSSARVKWLTPRSSASITMTTLAAPSPLSFWRRTKSNCSICVLIGCPSARCRMGPWPSPAALTCRSVDSGIWCAHGCPPLPATL